MISIFLLLLACSRPEVVPNTPAIPPRSTAPVVTYPSHDGSDAAILFVGNSLTAENDVPALVVELGRMDGREISVETYAPGGFGLGDHWDTCAPLSAMDRSQFDFFVGQQGPSSLPESLVYLKHYAKLYANACKQRNVQFALYMVWPDKTRAAYHDAVISNYAEAALETEAVLCPAGLAWQEAWREDPAIPLYGPDQFHPSMTGSVLAALTIYGALFEKTDFDFVVYEKMSWRNSVSEPHLDVMKRAAIKALNRF